MVIYVILSIMHKATISDKNIFWIGGSPCAGKSSIAKLLAERHNLFVHHCDDVSDARTEKMKSKALPVVSMLSELGKCARLAQSPQWQADTEISFYKEQFDSVLEELTDLSDAGGIVAEGADLMPELLDQIHVPFKRAIWIIPTPEFQLEFYRARAWAHEYVKDCQSPTVAFDNWMQRDILFAQYIQKTATKMNGRVLVVDGKNTIVQNADLVERHLGL